MKIGSVAFIFWWVRKIRVQAQNHSETKYMKKILAIIAAASLFAGANAEDKIVIKGSDTLGAKMVPQLAEAYKAAGNEVTFEIAAEGSSTAFTHLQAEPAGIGMSSRNIKDSETEAFTAKGMEIKDWTGDIYFTFSCHGWFILSYFIYGFWIGCICFF